MKFCELLRFKIEGSESKYLLIKFSCTELEMQIIIANELDYANDNSKTEVIEKIKYICRMTIKLIQKL